MISNSLVQRLCVVFTVLATELVSYSQRTVTGSADPLCEGQGGTECPCYQRNITTVCCHTELFNSVECWYDSQCDTTELVISTSYLNSVSITEEFLATLGVCTANLATLVIRDSQMIDLVVKGLPSLAHLVVRDSKVQGLVVVDLPMLTVLDMRNNSMVGRIQQPSNIPSINTLHLAGSDWPCLDPNTSKYKRSRSSLVFGMSMMWLLDTRWEEVWVDKETTDCRATVDTEPGISLRRFLIFSKAVRSQCPAVCECEVAVEAVSYTMEYQEVYKINMVCRDKGITSLPPVIPDTTSVADFSNNEITSLEALNTYTGLERIVLKNNSLNSLAGLGSSWAVKNSQILLDLRLNRISELDLVSLEPIFSTSSINSKSSFYLSENPWACTCQNIGHITYFLQKYSSLIKDLDEMRCDTWDTPILHSEYEDRCSEHGNPLVWVVVVELLLLVVLMTNLIRDIIQYRRTGELPYLARTLCWPGPPPGQSFRSCGESWYDRSWYRSWYDRSWYGRSWLLLSTWFDRWHCCYDRTCGNTGHCEGDSPAIDTFLKQEWPKAESNSNSQVTFSLV